MPLKQRLSNSSIPYNLMALSLGTESVLGQIFIKQLHSEMITIVRLTYSSSQRDVCVCVCVCRPEDNLRCQMSKVLPLPF